MSKVDIAIAATRDRRHRGSHHVGEMIQQPNCSGVGYGPTRKGLSVPTISAFWGTPDSLCSPRAFPSGIRHIPRQLYPN